MTHIAFTYSPDAGQHQEDGEMTSGPPNMTVNIALSAAHRMSLMQEHEGSFTE